MFELLNKNKNVIFEFIRYVISGSSAFLVDFSLMYIFNEYIFDGNAIYLSVAIGFIAGSLLHFLLACLFIFKKGREKVHGHIWSSGFYFCLIGFVGLILTELFMFLFVDELKINYLIAKIIAGGIVFIWNYSARKFLIFR